MRGDMPANWDEDVPVFPPMDKGIATCVASGKVMNAIAPRVPALIGGSADLDPSTYTALIGWATSNHPARTRSIEKARWAGGWSFAGRNEPLAGLRSVPRLAVIRPCDAHETAVAWPVALETRDRPVALILTRQRVPTLDRRAAASKLGAQDVQARVVSMPGWELFDVQTPEYREAVLPPSVTARLAIEAGASQGRHRYVGNRCDVLCVDRFGALAPGDVLLREYGFTVANVCIRVLAML